MAVWILTGNKENWERAVSDSIWGVREGRLTSYWDKLQKGDVVIFYVTSPISGVVGVGEVDSKFKQDKPLWPDEIREQRVIYPYRFGFKILAIVHKDKWKSDALQIGDLKVNFWAGMNPVSNTSVAEELLRRTREMWDLPQTILTPQHVQVEKEEIKSEVSVHNQVRDKLYEIGHLSGFVAEKEHHINGERLDVSWRRVALGVPTKVFEVQVGGNPHQALSKLKHAHDLWNSEPFMIVDKDSRSKVSELLEGTFHELKPFISVVPLEKVDELYQSLFNQKSLREEFGLE